jgi:hypothetical protein
MNVAVHLKRSTRIPKLRAAARVAPHGFLFDLAPGGVYRATDVTISAVRSYRTFSPLPHYFHNQAVYFLLHWP